MALNCLMISFHTSSSCGAIIPRMFLYPATLSIVSISASLKFFCFTILVPLWSRGLQNFSGKFIMLIHVNQSYPHGFAICGELGFIHICMYILHDYCTIKYNVSIFFALAFYTCKYSHNRGMFHD